ncbi:MAG TPA: 1,4-dihydroxy-2-naphthoate octaprenyltransferase [Candidatus Limnocylindria bacterium]|jgi:1,4-dihydroxy-2-naphthoate octaprenyltransferase|nr:1,4-dihydroxy-2-naphthoate octaprenyltransferase [Candidatus Limnocylindria bacterium]
MATLARRVGLGLAARGDVADTVKWAERARSSGLESVWFHDSYFERDAVTYATAVATQVEDIKVGLGALNPFTRHPVLIAMTISALDEIAPERIRLGLGSALPLRLGQMGIPYTPDDAVTRSSEAIDTLRTLWKGERMPPAKPGLPPLQPMFPPVHRVPIYVAGYRSPVMVLAGHKGDGYLARPAESIPGLKKLLRVMNKAAREAGRDPHDIDVAGYLLALVGDTRLDALNRAKREPFVIYMMSILSDVTLGRAGFEPELRDRIAAAWRKEDYTTAGGLIPDDLLDAFILCGTRREIADRAWEYHETGMDLPLLQPVVQDEDQVSAVLDAAVAYGTAEAGTIGARVALGVQQKGAAATLRDRIGGYWEIARPFSFTASTLPVAVGGALAAVEGLFDWTLFVVSLLAILLLHIGTNVTNEIYDVRKGVDTIVSPRASHAIVRGRITDREAYLMAIAAFAVAFALGLYLVSVRGWPIVALGLAGLIGGYTYTAPPFQYKFGSFGIPLVFLLLGPLAVAGSYYAITGTLDWSALAVSVPVGLLVAAILHGNEWRDISEDARAGAKTFSVRMGRQAAHWLYLVLVVGAYIALTVAVLANLLPTWSLLAMLSLPLLVRQIRSAEFGASGQQRAIAMIDLQTAQLHATFGYLMVAGLVIAAVVATR